MTKSELIEILDMFADDARICVTNKQQIQVRDIITVLSSNDDEAVLSIDCDTFV